MNSGNRSRFWLRRIEGRRMRRAWLVEIAALLVGLLTASPALAQQQVRIGIGFGLSFLPTYICEDLKLVEKYARQAHLDVRASYQRFLGAGPLQDAIASAAIDMGPFGVAPLLVAWEKAKGTPQQMLAVSGITTMPLELLSDQPGVRTIADLTPADRIALPSATAPQAYLLEMQAEKVFGQFDRLNGQVVTLSPAAAIAALVAGSGPATADFASPPFTQLALQEPGVHGILSTSEVMNGRASFLIMAATRRYIEANPKMPEVIDQAMAEAARLIHDNPRRAAQIYLTHEPSKSLDAAALEAVLKDIKDEFGSTIYGVQVFADFMGRHGQLKAPPRTWQDIVAPALLTSSSS
jgi:NitT/TauT family transport system substrate-binding protein